MPQRNKEERREYMKDWRKRSKRPSIEYRAKMNFLIHCKSVPCADCGRSYPHYVMEFDHPDGRGPNERTVSSFTCAAWSTLQAEVAKCDVVCANCHRVRTWKRGQQKRHTRRVEFDVATRKDWAVNFWSQCRM